MAKAMNVPILGLVENYSYIECGNCGERLSVFGESHVDEIAKKYNLEVLAKLPIDKKIAEAVDKGEIESLEGDWLDGVANFLEENVAITKTEENKADMKIAVPCEGDDINEHFAKCTTFKIYTIKNGVLDSTEQVSLEDTDHEKVALYMKENNINTVLCGGIAQGAMTELFNANIVVIPGMNGNIDVAVNGYLDDLSTH